MPMHFALLALAVQIGFAADAHQPLSSAQGRRIAGAADSVRDLRSARSAQASFERARRYNLPDGGGGSSERCDVNLGRMCWRYDETPPNLPPESPSITRRRAELIATLDAAAARHPGDDWIAGMRVHYRIEGKQFEAADSVARTCSATPWWCHAIAGYASQALGNVAAAESAFVEALNGMPEHDACRWRDIAALLPSNTRHYYEGLSCAARQPVEQRYWLLSRPQLGAGANEWRSEFYIRRLLADLFRQATTTQEVPWGRDKEELLVRYGWPIGWRKTQSMYGPLADVRVTEYEQTPSFNFAPVEALYDTSATSQDDGWELRTRQAEARFAPRGVKQVARVAMQVARFRRGDSVLVVAAHSAAHDSLTDRAAGVLAVALADGTVHTVVTDGREGRAQITVEAFPMLAGVEVLDTTTHTLARARALMRAPERVGTLALSDLLLFRAGDNAPESIDAALEAAIPGDTMSRARPIGIYWETYGIAEAGEAFDVSVTVERIDRSWFRGAKQLLRLAAPDNPLRLRWNDARPATPGQPLARAITLSLTNQPAGRYRVTLGLIRGDGTIVSSEREIELRD